MDASKDVLDSRKMAAETVKSKSMKTLYPLWYEICGRGVGRRGKITSAFKTHYNREMVSELNLYLIRNTDYILCF